MAGAPGLVVGSVTSRNVLCRQAGEGLVYVIGGYVGGRCCQVMRWSPAWVSRLLVCGGGTWCSQGSGEACGARRWVSYFPSVSAIHPVLRAHSHSARTSIRSRVGSGLLGQ